MDVVSLREIVGKIFLAKGEDVEVPIRDDKTLLKEIRIVIYAAGNGDCQNTV